MQQQLKISNGYFQLWYVFLNQQDVDYHALNFSVAQRHLIADILQQPIDQQSSYVLFMQLIEVTQHALNFPDFAFAMAKCIRPEHFGLLGYMASRSENMAQVLSYVVRFNRLVVDGASFNTLQYQHQAAQVRLFCLLSDMQYVFLHELTFAAMLQLARQFLGDVSLPLSHVRFAHAAQIPVYYYQTFYQCSVQFEQPYSEFVFSDEILSLAPQQPDPSLIQILIKQAEEDLAQHSVQPNVTQQLQLIIAQYLRLKQQAPKITDIAAERYVSVRTLQRQLSLHQTSFKHILEQQRIQRCNEMLAQNLTLSNIASALGYSDQSALARAYKAATGQTLLQKKQQFR